MNESSTYFDEHIRHFTCGSCEKWFAIGDSPQEKTEWFCPWCGEKQQFAADKGVK